MSCRSIALASIAAVAALVATFSTSGCGTTAAPPGGGPSSASTVTSSTATSQPTSTSSSTPPSSSTTLPPGAIPHPTGADQVVLRVSTGGGFIRIEAQYTLVPEFTLYGDGRIIVPGPTTLQFPGPALPNLQTAMISEAGIQVILAAAKQVDLFQNGVDYGRPGVADVGTTTFTINADGITYTSQIYALGFADGSGLTTQQQQARAAIDALRGKINDPSALIGAQLTWEPYDFTALAVYSRPVDSTATTGPTGVQPNYLPWPLADLATVGAEVPNSQGLRKVVVLGDDLATLRPLLDKATQITLWRSGNTEYNLWLRPLLPDEAAGS